MNPDLVELLVVSLPSKSVDCDFTFSADEACRHRCTDVVVDGHFVTQLVLGGEPTERIGLDDLGVFLSRNGQANKGCTRSENELFHRNELKGFGCKNDLPRGRERAGQVFVQRQMLKRDLSG